MRGLSKQYLQYTGLVMALQCLLPLAAWAEVTLTYTARGVELSAPNKAALLPLLNRLEQAPKTPLQVVAFSPQGQPDHRLMDERLVWLEAFFKERDLTLLPLIRSRTFLYAPTSNAELTIDWK